MEEEYNSLKQTNIKLEINNKDQINIIDNKVKEFCKENDYLKERSVTLEKKIKKVKNKEK
jgi:hypothetical protein